MKNRITFKIWLMAARPKTLPAAIAPVLIGTVLAFKDGGFHLLSAILVMAAALLMQVGTNFVNDYADFKKGSDTDRRVGPVRVTQAGLVSPEKMKKAVYFVFSLVILVSLYLVLRGGIPVLVIGILSIISAITYTAGPFPIGYKGFGDIFVLIFFGPVAVAGTYFVQSLSINIIPVIAGLGPGFLSVAILVVNNIRDVDEDKISGKNTLVVRFGIIFGRFEYFISVMIAFTLPFFLFLSGAGTNYSFLTILLTLFLLKPYRALTVENDPASLNALLGYTGKLLLLYSIVFCAGWMFPL
ncbi:MAG: 1,4-dihydroxy-2-naphthoate polyprenyltransferase [Acidobacteriota bacterium]